MIIERKSPESPVEDIMNGDARKEIKIHEHGLVALCDVMPRLVPKGKTADFAIVQAARVSYGEGTKLINEDKGLIRYLMRHRHTTPLEMVEFKFHCAMPIFVARQWIRTRMSSTNEYSGRYSIIKDNFYRPSLDNIKLQDTKNKQGGDNVVDVKTSEEFLEYLSEAEALYIKYEKMLEKGVARETARIGLPLSIYTEWYWKIDLHNLLNFLSLRMDKHAQQEIRDYANAIYTLIEPIVPLAMSGFRDYRLNAITLSSLEIESLKTGNSLQSDNKREVTEWEEKKKLFTS